jgi:pimeloyl-ACP methyl ester carboxylesterase
MPTDVRRRPVRFPSGGDELAAWHYPGTTGACVVMAGGLGVTKEPGTDRFARAFAAAGFTVLAFDHRGFGESGGSPRQVAGIRAQLADWEAALAFAARLPEVAPDRIAVWGFSSAGGHVLRIAAGTPGPAAAIAQSPNADGRAAARNAGRYQTPGAFLRLLGRAVVDAVGGLAGRPPLLVPLSGEPGTVAMLTTPDSRDGDRALDPDGAYGDWTRAVAARSALGVGFYRPGGDARRIRCPLLVVVSDDDRSVLAAPATLAAERAPRGELVRVPGGHYAPFLEAHEQVVAAELDFLRRSLIEAPAPARAG